MSSKKVLVHVFGVKCTKNLEVFEEHNAPDKDIANELNFQLTCDHSFSRYRSSKTIWGQFKWTIQSSSKACKDFHFLENSGPDIMGLVNNFMVCGDVFERSLLRIFVLSWSLSKFFQSYDVSKEDKFVEFDQN